MKLLSPTLCYVWDNEKHSVAAASKEIWPLIADFMEKDMDRVERSRYND